jgi:hypothetical protein
VSVETDSASKLRGLEERRDHVDAAATGHDHVEEHDVGLRRARLVDRLVGRPRLADDLDVSLGLEHPA